MAESTCEHISYEDIERYDNISEDRLFEDDFDFAFVEDFADKLNNCQICNNRFRNYEFLSWLLDYESEDEEQEGREILRHTVRLNFSSELKVASSGNIKKGERFQRELGWKIEADPDNGIQEGTLELWEYRGEKLEFRLVFSEYISEKPSYYIYYKDEKEECKMALITCLENSSEKERLFGHSNKFDFSDYLEVTGIKRI